VACEELAQQMEKFPHHNPQPTKGVPQQLKQDWKSNSSHSHRKKKSTGVQTWGFRGAFQN